MYMYVYKYENSTYDIYVYVRSAPNMAKEPYSLWKRPLKSMKRALKYIKRAV